MTQITISLNGDEITATQGSTVLTAALRADIYIPSLCVLPTLQHAESLVGSSLVYRGADRILSDDPRTSWDGCGICTVEVNGELAPACATKISQGMAVVTESPDIVEIRRKRLGAILAEHPNACLVCAQSEGCSLTVCSSNVPENKRCCALFGSCELQCLAHYVGVPRNMPKYKPRGLPVLRDEDFVDFDTELCIGCLRCVRACRRLRGEDTLSFVIKDGKPVVGYTAGPTRTESHCRFDGACVKVCPTGALLDKKRRWGKSVRSLPNVEKPIPLSKESFADVPEREGVLQIFDEDSRVIAIKGTMNMRDELRQILETKQKARGFTFEESPLFTKRESELNQQYIKEHGELPSGGDDELDDLY